MRNRRLWTVVGLFLALLLLALSTGCDGAVLNLRISYQGYLTDALGNPINGNRNMTFRMWNAATAGTNMWEETQNNVPVNGGHFSVALGSVTPLDPADFHKPLWLEVVVAGQTMGDRQPLQGAPYALSLAPGSVVKGNGTTGTYSTTLTVSNVGQGSAFFAYSLSGIGLTTHGNPAVVADGPIQSSATSYLWISGNSLVKNISTDSTRWDCVGNGGAQIWRGGVAGDKSVYYSATIPAVLYGQNVRVTKMTVYYKCQNSANGFITQTGIAHFVDADSWDVIANDLTDRTSTTATSYTLNLNTDNTLSAGQGGLGIFLTFDFADNSNYVQVGGVRLELEHD
jgi:hypothetical protein